MTDRPKIVMDDTSARPQPREHWSSRIKREVQTLTEENKVLKEMNMELMTLFASQQGGSSSQQGGSSGGNPPDPNGDSSDQEGGSSGDESDDNDDDFGI